MGRLHDEELALCDVDFGFTIDKNEQIDYQMSMNVPSCHGKTDTDILISYVFYFYFFPTVIQTKGLFAFIGTKGKATSLPNGFIQNPI